MNKKVSVLVFAAGVFITLVLLSPLPVFESPLSTVVEAGDGSLLGARIADDGQWRFPCQENLPDKFEKSILTSEDKYFYYHPGINFVSIIKAFAGNVRAGRIMSGGSTITMQVARIARGNRQRTYKNKIIEMLSAMKLELFRSKKEILMMYAANAPFGGNVVGIEAASWRYTGKASSEITWAEAAALSILPNSPALVYPGKNQEVLRSKRDKLLKQLYNSNYIDSVTMELSLEEPLPGIPKPLPSQANHLTDYYYLKNRGEIVRTTIDPVIQERATEIINSHQKILSENLIFNSACIIVEVSTGNVIAYVGNSNPAGENHGESVDIIQAHRSTGSILKPFLYAAMQQSGDILPNTIIADIPTRFQGFSPKNFDHSYNGAVSARLALSQSLNIPAVKMLQTYSPEKFHDFLGKIGFTTFDKPADHYGLSIILGGGETSLWELTGAYASLSRVLNNYLKEKKYFTGDYHPPVLIGEQKLKVKKQETNDPPLSASSVWLTYEALREVNRPLSETGWQYFTSSSKLAWKTGTSFGFRDAWAVGTTPQYVIGVWAGNAEGDGRPGLTGLSAAAPILFDLAGILNENNWFTTPDEDLTYITVCTKSGLRASPDCPETAETPASLNGLRSEACMYHKIVHLDKSETHQVNSDCAPGDEIVNVTWFVLPPAMEYFYHRKHPDYITLPPVASGCVSNRNIPVMEFIYPSSGIKIFIPRDQTGSLTRIIPEIAHRNPGKKIYWHLDESYTGTTRNIHQIEILAYPGNHVLTAVDEDGNMIKCAFSVTGKL